MDIQALFLSIAMFVLMGFISGYLKGRKNLRKIAVNHNIVLMLLLIVVAAIALHLFYTFYNGFIWENI